MADRELAPQAARAGSADCASALDRADTAGRAQLATWLQRRYGNAAVQRLVAEARGVPRPATARLQRQGAASPPAPAPPVPAAQAAQQAEASATVAWLKRIQQQMVANADRTVKNTGRLFSGIGGQPPRLRFDALTLRSDSAALARAAGQNPATTAYFFRGVVQDNTQQHTPHTMGTIDSNTILVRGRKSDGNWQSDEQVMGTFAHEASHILVASYGEHPGTTTNASSFDRYKDEFRAYWIEPVGRWAKLKPDDDKAEAIKKHLVGTSATDTNAYADLQKRYWNPANAAFKAQVDAHKRPDGFNLKNSPELDRLFQLLQGVAGGSATLENVLVQIVRLEPDERAEAASSPVIQKLYQALPGEGPARVRNALGFPQTAVFAAELNPSNSPASGPCSNRSPSATRTGSRARTGPSPRPSAGRSSSMPPSWSSSTGRSARTCSGRASTPCWSAGRSRSTTRWPHSWTPARRRSTSRRRRRRRKCPSTCAAPCAP